MESDITLSALQCVGVIFFIMGSIGSIVLLSNDFYDIDNCLNRKEFIRCILRWELLVWEFTENYVNIAGRIILVFLVTILALPFNAVCLLVMLSLELCRLVLWAFLKCFGKRGGQ